MSQDIYVVIEHLRGKVADISYVMLAAGRVMAEAAGGQVVAVLLGNDAQGARAQPGSRPRVVRRAPGIRRFHVGGVSSGA